MGPFKVHRFATLCVVLAGASDAANTFPSWNSTTHLFVFGDSYSQTGFNTSLAQPSPSNPLGNPAYPGYTSSNGPNWVDYLTTTYNSTFLSTIDLAYGGATVSAALVEPYAPTVLSLQDQILTEWIPTYSSGPATFPWQPATTIFALFIGINDIGNSYSLPNPPTTLYPSIFTTYASLLQNLTLTGLGARNFLLITVPPIDRSPLTHESADPAAQAREKQTVLDWNRNLSTLASDFESSFPDTTFRIFDLYGPFARLLDDPATFAETAAYRNTTTFCEAYQNGTPNPYYFDPSCGIPVDEYFWLNSLHPTFRLHQAFARLVAGFLS